MNHATLTRSKSTDVGTFGRLRATCGGAALELVTLELPWRGNQRRVSCIPEGHYDCYYGSSSKGNVYHVGGVPGRDGILIHAGNWAGDKTKGLRSDVEGCILLGMRRAVLSGQDAVTESKRACEVFKEFMDGQSFHLTISEDA